MHADLKLKSSDEEKEHEQKAQGLAPLVERTPVTLDLAPTGYNQGEAYRQMLGVGPQTEVRQR